jgi:hypothetical protein
MSTSGKKRSRSEEIEDLKAQVEELKAKHEFEMKVPADLRAKHELETKALADLRAKHELEMKASADRSAKRELEITDLLATSMGSTYTNMPHSKFRLPPIQVKSVGSYGRLDYCRLSLTFDFLRSRFSVNRKVSCMETIIESNIEVLSRQFQDRKGSTLSDGFERRCRYQESTFGSMGKA